MGLLKNKFARIIVAAVVVIVAGGFLWWHFRPAPANTVASTPGTVATAQTGNLRIDVSGTGNLAFSQTADCAFDVAGYVEKVYVEVGDQIKKDQLLAQVDPTYWQNQKRSQERSVISARMSLTSARMNLMNLTNQGTSSITGQNVAPDPLDVQIKELQVKLAQQNLDNAQQQLDKTLANGPEVHAPFDGFVTKVNVKGGGEVFKGTIAVSIADPNKFEAKVLVNETDITKIQVGTSASVGITSLPNVYLPAKVTTISPTAVISGGVVNYAVQVEVQNQPMPQFNGQPANGAPPGQSGQGNRVFTGSGSGNTLSGSTRFSSGMSPVTLRDGLSVSVSLLVKEKQNVVMVPIRAIIRKGQNTTVQVVKDDLVESRPVKIGDSNTQYTEVTEGLADGEKVIVPPAPTTTSNRGPFGGMPRIGG